MIAEDQEDYNSTNNASNTAVYYFENPSIHPHYHVQAYQGRGVETCHTARESERK